MIGGLNVTRTSEGVAFALLAGAAALASLVADHLTTPFDPLFDHFGDLRGIDSNLLRALARVETGFNVNAVGPPNRNGTRDYGLMQINERTARQYGFDPAQLVGNASGSIDVAARYLLDLYRGLGSRYSTPAIISSYNEGLGNFIAHGVLDATYVAKVQYHLWLYSMGRVLA